jgi:hypothetical protein
MNCILRAFILVRPAVTSAWRWKESVCQPHQQYHVRPPNACQVSPDADIGFLRAEGLNASPRTFLFPSSIYLY